MCTMTHFAKHSTASTNHPANLHPVVLQAYALASQTLVMPRFQVIPAGKSFFHIKETATGRVRGFRTNHNDACTLARSLAAHN
ncbi:hypothetical protein [Pseudomonas frederiksbergensis]|jgi:hypothetical protein|uniref:Uncharacterized protein n=1 Tax=Pseudomonas frederiksbergensis TaxID=104087 RepID=A0A6L5BUV2_9PSED|nr:hypothetical protein [Pseudomonas frederiksbergensis]KAF2391835.1 hypothetical protein FX983_06320 [Pseudomonas frederiksbergensis]